MSFVVYFKAYFLVTSKQGTNAEETYRCVLSN